jgi:7-cyano-7-deazaguanine synthase in queuosine biosynthesis
MSNKRPLLLFSGGLDSTAMLYYELQNTDVDVLYIKGGQHDQKIQAELLARNSILDWLKDDRPVEPGKEHHQVVRDRSFDSINFAVSPGILACQPTSWMVAALYHVNPEIHSEVRIAYVMGDDALIYRHEMVNAWNYLLAFSKGVSDIPLVFPLMRWRKENILHHLPIQLVERVWVCELPVWKGQTITACGKCRPCKRHQKEMLEQFGSMKNFRQRCKEARKADLEARKNRPKPLLEVDPSDLKSIDAPVVGKIASGDSSIETDIQLSEAAPVLPGTDSGNPEGEQL